MSLVVDSGFLDDLDAQKCFIYRYDVIKSQRRMCRREMSYKANYSEEVGSQDFSRVNLPDSSIALSYIHGFHQHPYQAFY